MKKIMQVICILFMFFLLSFLPVMFAPEGEDSFSRNFALPSSLLVIEDEAFMGSAFEDVVIPEGVESIGARAFADNRSMKTVKIPGSVCAIGAEAFGETAGLVIIGEGGSYAEKWAVIHHAAFIPTEHSVTLHITGSWDQHEALEAESDTIQAEIKKRLWFLDPDQSRIVRSCEKVKMHPIDLVFP